MASLALLPEARSTQTTIKQTNNQQSTTNNLQMCCLLMLVTPRCWYTTAASLRRENNHSARRTRGRANNGVKQKQRNQNASRENENVAVWRFGRKPQSYHRPLDNLSTEQRDNQTIGHQTTRQPDHQTTGQSDTGHGTPGHPDNGQRKNRSCSHFAQRFIFTHVAHGVRPTALCFSQTQMMMRINASNEPPRGELRDSPNDVHRVSVIIFEDQGSFGVLFCEGPEQDRKILPWPRPAYRATTSPMIRRRFCLVTRKR